MPKLRLYDVDDVAAFVSAIVNRSGLELSWHDSEDLHAYLVEESWKLSLKYSQGDPRLPANFSGYAGTMLRHRVVDWQRKRLGRTRWKSGDRVYERERPQLVSLESLDPDNDRLESALAGSGLDSGRDQLADELRLLRERARPEVRRRLSRRTA